jgi:hypothetical protein
VLDLPLLHSYPIAVNLIEDRDKPRSPFKTATKLTRAGMVYQYIIAIIVAAGVAFWYDFKSWQSFGSQLHHYHSI